MLRVKFLQAGTYFLVGCYKLGLIEGTTISKTLLKVFIVLNFHAFPLCILPVLQLSIK